MKPPPFEYHAPESVAETLDLLQQLGEDAKVLAGGQSLVPLLNLRLARPAHLVDINAVQELSSIAAWDGGVSLGAHGDFAMVGVASVLRLDSSGNIAEARLA